MNISTLTHHLTLTKTLYIPYLFSSWSWPRLRKNLGNISIFQHNYLFNLILESFKKPEYLWRLQWENVEALKIVINGRFDLLTVRISCTIPPICALGTDYINFLRIYGTPEELKVNPAFVTPIDHKHLLNRFRLVLFAFLLLFISINCLLEFQTSHKVKRAVNGMRFSKFKYKFYDIGTCISTSVRVYFQLSLVENELKVC